MKIRIYAAAAIAAILCMVGCSEPPKVHQGVVREVDTGSSNGTTYYIFSVEEESGTYIYQCTYGTWNEKVYSNISCPRVKVGNTITFEVENGSRQIFSTHRVS